MAGSQFTRGPSSDAPGTGPIYFARSIQPSPHGKAVQLELPRSRSPATLNVHLRTLGKAGSLGPRLARNLAQYESSGGWWRKAGPRENEGDPPHACPPTSQRARP